MTRSDWFDATLALALTGGAQAEIWNANDLSHKSAAAASAALLTLLVAVRRRLPLVCGLVAMTTLVVQQAAIGDVEKASAVTVAALVVSIYSLGAYGRALPTRVGGAACAAAFIAVSIAKDKPVGDLVFVSVVLFAPGVLGILLHTRRESERNLARHAARVERQAVLRAQAAVEEERARIARELHDVVAHAMSVIVVQAGAERIVLPPEQQSTRAVLETIERTGRQALGEMRRLLGMMRADEKDLALAPQPSLAFLPDLCEQVRAAGLPVVLQVDGEPGGVPPGVDVSAYRIVQEALTNALKHAGPASARVSVRYLADRVEVEVADDGRGAAQSDGGHGLLGMRERVAVYGGRFEAGNRPAGGYRVRVQLPLQEPA